LGFGLVFGEADPRHFGVGVGLATAIRASMGWPTMWPMAKMCGTLGARLATLGLRLSIQGAIMPKPTIAHL
jgi:hypothetical protein